MKGFVIILALFICPTILPAQKLQIPFDAASVMIDGRIEEHEWKNALKIPVNDSTSLYLKQDAENIYWCLFTQAADPALMMVDFYMQHSGEMLNLHASAKLGERKWASNSYGEWIWWNNDGWQANVVRNGESPRGRFLYDDAKEFQLRKTRFHEKSFRLMLDISFPQNMTMKFPADALEVNPQGWLEFLI